MTEKSPSTKTAIITGGGTGVGRATALQLAGLGYAVAVVYSRSQAEAEGTVAELVALGGRALAVRADVAVDAECRAMVGQVVAALGRVDVLVNCAGTTAFIPFDNLDAVTDEVWDTLFHVNVLGAFHCARAVRAAMLENGGGQIINVSSVAAKLGQGSSIPYCASKAALDSLTVSLARTLAPQIRVNAVAPGFITGRWLEGGLGGELRGGEADLCELAAAGPGVRAGGRGGVHREPDHGQHDGDRADAVRGRGNDDRGVSGACELSAGSRAIFLFLLLLLVLVQTALNPRWTANQAGRIERRH